MARARATTRGTRPSSSGRRRRRRRATTSHTSRWSPARPTPTRAASRSMAEHAATVAHQFDDAEQQRGAAELGMWIFLATEVMFFGGMFTAFTAYRWLYPAPFAHASRHLDVPLGGTNTVVLIGSSLTMALAVHGAREGHRRMLLVCLALTMLLGSVFLGIKAIEWGHKWEDGLVPGLRFTLTGADRGPQAPFLSPSVAIPG